MKEYKYLIIGGGMTADSAVRGIRQNDQGNSIALFSTESYPPYNRPPLSKGLWGDMDEKNIWRRTEDEDPDIYLNTTISTIEPKAHTVTESAGKVYRYEKLLLATGGSPITLSDATEEINYFRTYDDYKQLREEADNLDQFVVIGGGFIGSEIAAALASLGKDVTMVFPEDGIGGGRLPTDLAWYLNGYYEDRGVSVRHSTMVTTVDKTEAGFIVTTKDGDTISGDAVVAGLGIRPNTSLARNAGLEVDDGIVVDGQLRTSHPDIFAAGDCARFYSPALDSWLRVEHEENANIQGMTTGANMTGEEREYDYLPMFYSDLFDHGYEAVGSTSFGNECVEDWEEKYQSGVLYYLDDKRLVGVVLWNVWGKIDVARELIKTGQEMTAKDVVGSIEAG